MTKFLNSEFRKNTNNYHSSLVIYDIWCYIYSIVVEWGEVLIFQQWLIDNRYISANTHGNRPSKNDVCNEMDEMCR